MYCSTAVLEGLLLLRKEGINAAPMTRFVKVRSKQTVSVPFGSSLSNRTETKEDIQVASDRNKPRSGRTRRTTRDSELRRRTLHRAKGR